MDITQAANMLAKNNANTTYDIHVPSLGKKIPFMYMTVSNYKSMAKAVMEGNSKFDEFLAGLILTLSSGVVLPSTINRVDKLYILAGIKYKHVDPSTDITLKCVNCLKPIEHIDIFENYNNEINTTNEDITYTIGELNVTLSIGLPSLEVDHYFNLYAFDKFDTSDDSQMIIREYERQLMNIRSITINGEDVVDYDTCPILQKLSILSHVSDEYFDLEVVDKVITSQLSTCIIKHDCKHCKDTSTYITRPEDFFL
jgi:hypothetical protein